MQATSLTYTNTKNVDKQKISGRWSLVFLFVIRPLLKLNGSFKYVNSFLLRVEFLLKTNSGYPKPLSNISSIIARLAILA